jgi:hypothetical protein
MLLTTGAFPGLVEKKIAAVAKYNVAEAVAEVLRTEEQRPKDEFLLCVTRQQPSGTIGEISFRSYDASESSLKSGS